MTEEQETIEQEKTPETTETKQEEPVKEEKLEPKISDKQETNSKEDIPKKPLSSEDKDNTIFIGIKPFMNYVTGVVMQFKNKGQDEVIVSARGKFISKAVDVTEVARRTFLKEENIKVKDIKISSEAFENKEGKRINVSAIEIVLVKP
jgi:DNA-binding protein